MVVTRAADQQGAARQLLEQRGATVLDLPALVIGPPDHWAPLDDALADSGELSLAGVLQCQWRAGRGTAAADAWDVV